MNGFARKRLFSKALCLFALLLVGCTAAEKTEVKLPKAAKRLAPKAPAKPTLDKKAQESHTKHLELLSKVKAVTPEQYCARAEAYSSMYEFDLSIKDLNKALELDPKYLPALVAKGALHRYLNEYEKSIEDFNKVLAVNPKLANAYVERGLAYGQLDNFQKQAEDCTQAIEIDPTNAWAYESRG